MIERLGATKRFLMFFRDMREDFLSPGTTIESSGLKLLVGRWSNLQQRRAARGRGFDFGGGVIVWWLGARKCE